jgi:hypothetical protein
MTAVMDMTALESRAEVDSLEALQAERRELLPRFTKLAAKFRGGNSASADTKRKQHRALVAKRILADWKADKEPSEAALERMANADVEHIAFCETIEREFTEYVLLEYRLTEIVERIRNRETCLNVYNAELRLAR